MNIQEYRASVKPFHFSYSGSFMALSLLTFFMFLDSLAGPNLYAQIKGVEVGDRVKISAPTVARAKMKGIVASFSPSSLSLTRKDTTLLIPYPLIRAVEMPSGKKRNIGKGMLIGSLSGGLLLGGLAYLTNDSSCNEEEEWCLFVWSDAEAFLIGAKVGALIGFPLGGFIGAFIKSDRWEKVPLNISAGVVPVSFEKQEFKPAVTVRTSFGNNK